MFTLTLTPHQVAVVLANLKHSALASDAVPVYISIVKQLDMEAELGVILGAKQPNV